MNNPIDLNAAVRRFEELSGVPLKLQPNGKHQGACPLCEAGDPKGHHLYVEVGDRQPAVWHCARGCDQEELTERFWSGGFGNGQRPPNGAKPERRRVAVHDYPKADGSRNLRVERWHTADATEPKGYKKDCFVSHWEGDQWVKGLGGAERVLYQLPAILAQPEAVILWTEGENKVDALRERGFLATTSLGGCGQKGKLPDLSVLAGREVWVLADYDEPGEDYAELVLKRLQQAGARAFAAPSLPREKPKPAGYDVVDWFREGHTAEELRALLTAPGDEWPELIDLEEPPLPALPVTALPDWLQLMAQAVSQSLQIPVDVPALIGLTAVSLAVQRRIEARPRADWREPLSLWVLITLPPGNLKSPCYAEMMEPVDGYEIELAANMAGEVAADGARRAAVEARLKRLRDQAAREDDLFARKGLIDEAAGLAAELAAAPPVVAPRFLTDDVTPEKLAALMSEQGGRIGVMSAETDAFSVMAGRYSDGIANFSVYLKSHSGDDIRVDRLGRPSIVVRRPALTMCLLAQPGVIARLKERPEFRERGLLARFLYCTPRSWVGQREIGPAPVPDAVRQDYAERLAALLATPAAPSTDGQHAAHSLTFTAAACTELSRYRANLEPRLAEGGDLGGIADWAGKLAGVVVRLAALLHLAQRSDLPEPWSAPVDGESVTAAAQLAEDLAEHARAAYRLLGGDPGIALAGRIGRWLREREGGTVSRRAIHHRFQGTVPAVEELRRPLELLVEHGYLRPAATSAPDRRGGRPSAEYDVNPALRAAAASEGRSQ